jgi:hypothetical protein
VSWPKNTKLKISPQVETALHQHFAVVDASGELGNARYARELFNKMCSRMHARVYEKGSIELQAISAFELDDVPEPDAKFKTTPTTNTSESQR